MPSEMSDEPRCTCVRSDWNADQTALVNTFELDQACPIHGDDAVLADAAPNRWAAFTDEELAQLADVDEFGNFPDRSYFERPLWQEIKAELERRRGDA